MNTQIILNNQYSLDLTEDLNLFLTYQCGDIRKVLNSKSSLSKTLSIKGSTTNNQAFSNLFDVRNYSDFNPNRKAPVLVISGGIKIFEGYLKVDSIKITNTDSISYECTMYSNVADFFTELSNLKLNELDFTEYNHVYSTDNVVGSWNDFIIINGQETPVRKGLGYVYPYVDLGNDGSLTNIKYTEFFKPAFYAKTVLDKIFSNTDYSYSSSFLNSDYFKSLIIIPSAGSYTLSDTIFNNIKVWASQEEGDSIDVVTKLETIAFSGAPTPAQNIGTPPMCQSLAPTIYDRGFTGRVLSLPNTTVGGRYDTGHNFDVTSSVYTVPVTGYYTFVTNFNLDISISNDSYAANAVIPELHIASQHQYICSIEVTGGTLDQYGFYPVYALETQTLNKVYDSIFFQNDKLLGVMNEGSSPNFDFNSGTPHFLNAGDKVSISVFGNYKLSFIKEAVDHSSYDFKPRIEFLQISPSDLKVELMDNQIHEGMGWDFTNYISGDQCSDYILSLAKMFNLYFEFDTANDNTLVIEPRKDFYEGDVIDWTDKLDRSNESEIFPMSEISAKNLHFLYRNDSDYWNDKYQKENLSTNKFSLLSQLTYGEFTYRLDNDFVDLNSEEKIDLIFAPTPLVQDAFYTNLTGGTYSSSTKVISTIYQQEYDNDTGNLKKKPLNSFAPRILFYNGLVDCDGWGMYDYSKPTNDSYYENLLSLNSGNTSWQFIDYPHNTLTSYPYAGHLDNPFSPSEDLNFTYPAEYFYNRKSVTNSNLFNKYWYDTIKEIEDKSAKLFTGYFHLTIADIQALSFRNIIYLDSSYWIINQIIDYCPLDNGLTKVELVKLINYNQTDANIGLAQQTINLEPTSRNVTIGSNTTLIGGVNISAISPSNNSNNNINLIGGTGSITLNGLPAINITSSGLTFTNPVSLFSGTPNEVVYVDASGNLAVDSGFTYSPSSGLTVTNQPDSGSTFQMIVGGAQNNFGGVGMSYVDTSNGNNYQNIIAVLSGSSTGDIGRNTSVFVASDNINGNVAILEATIISGSPVIYMSVQSGNTQSVMGIQSDSELISVSDGNFTASLDADNTGTSLSYQQTSGGTTSGFMATSFGTGNTQSRIQSNGVWFNFPTSDGLAGQPLVTDGSGNLSFAPITGFTALNTFAAYTASTNTLFNAYTGATNTTLNSLTGYTTTSIFNAYTGATHSSFTGGTVTGATSFTGGLSANTMYSGGTLLSTVISNIALANSTGATNFSNTVFVSSLGNDTTGTKYNISQPYKTISKALSAATTGDTIFVMAGTYTDTGLFKDGVNYYFENGAILSPTGATSIFFASGQTNNDFSVDGFLTVNSSQNACVFDFYKLSGGTRIDIKYKYILMTNLSGSDSITNRSAIRFYSTGIANSLNTATFQGDIKITSNPTVGSLYVTQAYLNITYNGSMNMTSASPAIYINGLTDGYANINGNFASAGGIFTVYLSSSAQPVIIRGNISNTSVASGIYALASSAYGATEIDANISGSILLNTANLGMQTLNGAIFSNGNNPIIRLSSGYNNINASMYKCAFYIDGGINTINGTVVLGNSAVTNIGPIYHVGGTTHWKALSGPTLVGAGGYQNVISGGTFNVTKGSVLNLSDINNGGTSTQYGMLVSGNGTLIVEGVINYATTASTANLGAIKLSGGTLQLDGGRIINNQTGATACSISAVTNQNVLVYSNTFTNKPVSGGTLTNLVTGGGSIITFTGMTF